MLKAMLAAWDKKGERYSFANVSVNLEKDMLSVLPAGINILRVRTDTDSADSDENVEEAGALLAVACGKETNQNA
jgi:arabinogalactan endo-1,4-beta-galactosidase